MTGPLQMDDNGASDRLPANRLLGVRHFDTTAITASTPGMEKVGVRTPVIAVKMNAARGSSMGFYFRVRLLLPFLFYKIISNIPVPLPKVRPHYSLTSRCQSARFGQMLLLVCCSHQNRYGLTRVMPGHRSRCCLSDEPVR